MIGSSPKLNNRASWQAVLPYITESLNGPAVLINLRVIVTVSSHTGYKINFRWVIRRQSAFVAHCIFLAIQCCFARQSGGSPRLQRKRRENTVNKLQKRNCRSW